MEFRDRVTHAVAEVEPGPVMTAPELIEGSARDFEQRLVERDSRKIRTRCRTQEVAGKCGVDPPVQY